MFISASGQGGSAAQVTGTRLKSRSKEDPKIDLLIHIFIGELYDTSSGKAMRTTARASAG